MNEELSDKSSLPLYVFSLLPYRSLDSIDAIRHFLSGSFLQLSWPKAKSAKISDNWTKIAWSLDRFGVLRVFPF
jgi:hypothetical protein